MLEGVNEYRRPALPTVTFRDERGNPIEYGSRWGDEPAPEASYSRTSNPERFAPLHTVARALVDWLEASFDLAVERGAAVAADLLHTPGNVVDAMRLVPRDPGAAPLTLVLDSFPSVSVHAGALHDFTFPDCGCDACDDDVTDVADELEWTVRTVVAGGYSERLEPRPSRWFVQTLEEPGNAMRSTRIRLRDLPADRVKAARQALPDGGRWAAWRAKH